jgi:carbamate kinase
MLVIATDVEAVMTGFDTDDPKPVGEVSVAELREIVSREDLPAGSMRPKVQTVTRFAERTGGTGVITSLCRIADAVEGSAGTRVSR